MASQISCVFVVSAIWDARSVMCSVKCMYDLPYEMQYELYSDMLKQLYCGSYSIALTPNTIFEYVKNVFLFTNPKLVFFTEFNLWMVLNIFK